MNEEITAKLGLDQSALERGLAGANHQINEFAEKTKEGFTDILKELAAPISAAGVIAGVEKVFGRVEEIERVAEATGLTAELYQRFVYAAKEVGVESESSEKSLEFLSKTIGEAAEGAKGAVEVFDRWHISIKTAGGELKSTGTLVDEISNAMADMKDPALRAAMAQDLLGKSGAKLVSILSQGAKALHERGAGAAIITDEDIEAVKEAHQAIEKVEDSFVVGTAKIIGWGAAIAGFFGKLSASIGGHRKGENLLETITRNFGDQATGETMTEIGKMKTETAKRIAERDKIEGATLGAPSSPPSLNLWMMPHAEKAAVHTEKMAQHLEKIAGAISSDGSMNINPKLE